MPQLVNGVFTARKAWSLLVNSPQKRGNFSPHPKRRPKGKALEPILVVAYSFCIRGDHYVRLYMFVAAATWATAVVPGAAVLEWLPLLVIVPLGALSLLAAAGHVAKAGG